jgi:hypothetical protein
MTDENETLEDTESASAFTAAVGSRWIDHQSGQVAICKRVEEGEGVNEDRMIWNVEGGEFLFSTRMSIFKNSFSIENSKAL